MLSELKKIKNTIEDRCDGFLFRDPCDREKREPIVCTPHNAMAFFYAIAGFSGGLLPYNTVSNWIFMGFFFFWTGANANLVMSHAVSVFGPRDYPRIWGRMAPILNLMRVLSPMVLSVFLANAATAVVGYRHAYAFFGCASIVALILIFFADQHIFKKPGEAPTGAAKV
jgi:hypothetical protein